MIAISAPVGPGRLTLPLSPVVKPRGRIPLVLALLLLAFATWWGASSSDPALDQVPPPAGTAGGQPTETGPTAGGHAAEPGGLVVRDVVVRDVNGRVAWRGDVDLAPALARIERGEKDPHRNDGGVFGNREGRLPARERGYYREYVVRTPGISHAGPQRLIIGGGGEVYYTSDHYESFRRIR
jgi:ribonuclease T1